MKELGEYITSQEAQRSQGSQKVLGIANTDDKRRFRTLPNTRSTVLPETQERERCTMVHSIAQHIPTGDTGKETSVAYKQHMPTRDTGRKSTAGDHLQTLSLQFRVGRLEALECLRVAEASCNSTAHIGQQFQRPLPVLKAPTLGFVSISTCHLHLIEVQAKREYTLTLYGVDSRLWCVQSKKPSARYPLTTQLAATSQHRTPPTLELRRQQKAHHPPGDVAHMLEQQSYTRLVQVCCSDWLACATQAACSDPDCSSP